MVGAPECGTKRSRYYWEGLPLLMVFLVHASIAISNWPYERRMFTTDPAVPGWIVAHLGLILTATSIGLALFAGYLLDQLRISESRPPYKSWSTLLGVSFILMFLVFPSLFIVVLGPAAVQMLDTAQTGLH